MKGFFPIAAIMALLLGLTASTSSAEEIQFTLLAERSCDGTAQQPYAIDESQQFILPDNMLRYITFTTVRTGGVASVINPTDDLIPYFFRSHFWVTPYLDIPNHWGHDLTTISDWVEENELIPAGAIRSVDIDFEQTKRSLLIDAPVCAPAEPLTIGVVGECYSTELGESDLLFNRWIEISVRLVYRPLPDEDSSCNES